jgi:hypothetical protein
VGLGVGVGVGEVDRVLLGEVSWENYGEECRRLWSARGLDVTADGGVKAQSVNLK